MSANGEILNQELLKPLRLGMVRPASRKTDRDRKHVTLNSPGHEHEARTRIPKLDLGMSKGKKVLS
jgi:hypothetical protein